MADRAATPSPLMGIRKLAKDLNLSIGTVSRALNGRPDVKNETRQRVQEAALAMGYVPNQSGRSLRQGTTKTIGFTFNNSADGSRQADYFFLGVAEGAQSVFSEHDLDLVMLPHPGMAASHGHLKRVVARQMVDGIIITGTHPADRRIDLLQKARVPFVSLGRIQMGEDVAWVDLDFAAAARQSVERLYGKGHHRIAVWVPDNQSTDAALYLDGYREAITRLGLPLDPALMLQTGPSTAAAGLDIDTLLQSGRPTAVLVFCELMVHHLYAKMAERDLRVGRDLAVIGFRMHPGSKLLQPKLTAFDLDVVAIGRQLALQLLSRMPIGKSGVHAGNNNVIWEMHLSPGDSDF